MRLSRMVLWTFFAVVAAPLAAAQEDPLAGLGDPIEGINGSLPRVDADERADLELLPLVGAMDEPPAVIGDGESAALLTPDDPAWGDVEAWVTGEAQVAAVAALRRVTDPDSDYLFALPYGEAAPADLRRLGVYVDLGTPARLGAAEFVYLDALDRLASAAFVEATRLAEAGEGLVAAETVLAWVRLGRMLIDRPMLEESATGYAMMMSGAEYLRDLVYRYPASLDERALRGINRDLSDRDLYIERLTFPDGRRLAALDAVREGFVERGGPNPETFGLAMARLEPETEGLQRLNAAAAWRSLAGGHAGYYATLDEIEAVFRDWKLRWPLSPYDVIMEQPSHYSTLDAQRFAVVTEVVGPHDVLFDLRQRLRAELGGTRLALGVVGYRQKYGSWPNQIFSIRPGFVREVDTDPYDPREQRPFEFFVPVRDAAAGPREEPQPHRMTVHLVEDGFALELLGGGVAVQSMLRQAFDAGVTPEMMAQVAAGFVATIENEGIRRGNVREKVEGMNTERFASMISAGEVGTLGEAQLRELAVAQIRSALSFPEYGELAAQVERAGRRRGATLDAALARRFVNHLMRGTDRLFRRLQRQARHERGELGEGVEVFDVTLDDSTFVLYSVGPDGRDDGGTQVGDDGFDVLMWPPLLSLQREHAG